MLVLLPSALGTENQTDTKIHCTKIFILEERICQLQNSFLDTFEFT